jgi:hypothetical protein
MNFSEMRLHFVTTGYATENYSPHAIMYAVGLKSSPPDIQKPRQMENAVRDI